jgi:hypothetical protein
MSIEVLKMTQPLYYDSIGANKNELGFERGSIGTNCVPLVPFMGVTNLQHIQYI